MSTTMLSSSEPAKGMRTVFVGSVCLGTWPLGRAAILGFLVSEVPNPSTAHRPDVEAHSEANNIF